ncbi:MAG TPA: ribose-phosphate pyrophosphokinase [Thermoanaerobaculia bacterium]|jgi:ribose-phosphate pyrophosphokinase|nr:ribose-phosphate pyrophosphokinase [Thermoanaerobaculia bacterium]
MYGALKVFGGRAHPALTQQICDYLNLPTGRVVCFDFSDGETFFQIEENVRGVDVFIIQPTCPPVNNNLIELLVMIDAFKRASATRVTAVVPYYGYGRQDKKDKPRVPVTAKLMADLISRAGADRLLTMDLHAAQVAGFFDMPVDHLFAAPVILDAIRDMGIPEVVIVSPDAGGVARARAIAKRLDVDLAIVDKRRIAPNEAEIMNVIGDVRDRDVLIVDDIVDTAGTLVNTVEALRAQGARRIFAAGIHGILSGPALDRIERSALEALLVTDTTPIDDKLEKSGKLRGLSVAPLLGEAIRRIHDNSSVTALFV